MNATKTGSFIAELRRERGLTQRQLAETLLVSDKAVSRWETGRGLPDVENLAALADALGVSVAELLRGPQESGHYPTLPSDATLLSVMVQENVCYVNFDSSVQNAAFTVSEQAAVYSIVNSLADTCRIEKVQISIDGSTDKTFRSEIELSNQFERNGDLIAGE